MDMTWLLVATIAYFLLALEIILDKFLLSSERVSHPAIYAFYSGTLGLGAFIFAPWGFHLINSGRIILSFAAGIIFIYGMLALFFAVNKSEASRVLPVVGATVPIVVFLLAFFFLGEHFGATKVFGIAALVLGGLWISINLSDVRGKLIFRGFYPSIIAGIFLATAATMFKFLYQGDNFLNVYIWTRLGAFLGVLSFLFLPGWRKTIFDSLLKFKKPANGDKGSGLMFVLAKILGGSGSILKEHATSIAVASVTVINALVSLEYVFIFILGVIFSAWMPNVIQEKKDLKTVLQKISAIIIIAIGLVLVSGFKRHIK